MAPEKDDRSHDPSPADLGDLVILLLAGTLAGLRDRLYEDGFCRAGDHVADLVDITDGYVCGVLD